MKKFLPILFIVFAFFSCEEILMEEDISGKHVLLTAPYNNAVLTSTGITFTWEPIEYESRYRLQIARPDFENPLEIVTDIVVDTTSFTTQLNIGAYQWRVQAVNSGYRSAFSTRSFTIQSNEDFQNNSVALTIPADNLLTNIASQQLQWQPVIGTVQYEVRIINTVDNTVIAGEMTTATSFQYAFPQGNFQWMVRATNGSAYTLFSSRNLSVDTTSPNEPILNMPANEQVLSENEVTFQWSREPGGGSVERDSIYIYRNSGLSLLEYKNEHNPSLEYTLDEGTYYWYVRAFDAAGNAGPQSEVFSFIVN